MLAAVVTRVRQVHRSRFHRHWGVWGGGERLLVCSVISSQGDNEEDLDDADVGGTQAYEEDAESVEISDTE